MMALDEDRSSDQLLLALDTAYHAYVACTCACLLLVLATSMALRASGSGSGPLECIVGGLVGVLLLHRVPYGLWSRSLTKGVSGARPEDRPPRSGWRVRADWIAMRVFECDAATAVARGVPHAGSARGKQIVIALRSPWYSRSVFVAAIVGVVFLSLL